MELQVWLIGGCAVVVAILATMILNTATNDQVYIQLQPLLVLGFYASAAYAVTTHRLFDSAQILLIAVNKAALIAGATGVAYLVFIGSQQMLPTGLAFVPTTIAALLTAVTMQSWLDRWFKFFPQATKARQEAFAVAGRESRVENLEKGFVKILQGWGQTDNALVLVGNGGPVRALGAELTDDSAAMRTLRQLRWISPERLAREKTSAERQILAKILSDNRLGVMAVGQNPTLGVVVSVGVPATYRPYTYPQVMQLMELISIFEGAFERAYLTAKMQHAEQLATVGLLGASLAHEIRNPLVSIKTFVQLLPSRYQDAAFRDKFFRLMTDEVARIDRLTEQLLELASPRAYVSEVIELHPVLRASLDLVAPKAAIRHVQILTDLQAVPDKAYIDASAVKQVLLNLCFNAIQALENRDGNDWIKVTTRRVQDHIEIAVSDSGPGIAPEMQTRLFQPFQSTKSTGFGLGLAICRDILVGLNASIAVDPPTNGGGATFRVTIPCQPS